MGKDDTEVIFGKLLEINSHSMFNRHFHFVFTKPAQDEQAAGPSEKEDEVSDTMYLSGDIVTLWFVAQTWNLSNVLHR